jgi:uncharacterized protein YgiM (DUF1202 family)
MRRTAVLVVVATLLAAGVVASAAHAASTRKVCARVATIRDTPRGFVIARLYRGQTVRVERRSGEPGWTIVTTRRGLPGWILTRSLCRGR